MPSVAIAVGEIIPTIACLCVVASSAWRLLVFSFRGHVIYLIFLMCFGWGLTEVRRLSFLHAKVLTIHYRGGERLEDFMVL